MITQGSGVRGNEREATSKECGDTLDATRMVLVTPGRKLLPSPTGPRALSKPTCETLFLTALLPYSLVLTPAKLYSVLLTVLYLKYYFLLLILESTYLTF